jgi:hypothetical protein
LNVHFHSIVPDGVFLRADDGAVRFQPLPPPSEEVLQKVLRRVAARITKLLQPLRKASEDDARPLDAQGYAQAESVTGLGLRRGQAQPKKKKHAAVLNGFSLHNGVHLHANDREGLAHLCGYGARPALGRTARPGSRRFPSRRGRSGGGTRREGPAPAQRADPWAKLLLRVFREDVLSCPCGGRRKVIAFIEERKTIEAILRSIRTVLIGGTPRRRRQGPADPERRWPRGRAAQSRGAPGARGRHPSPVTFGWLSCSSSWPDTSAGPEVRCPQVSRLLRPGCSQRSRPSASSAARPTAH